MLNILDGVINQNRFDVDVVDEVITSGIEGLWIAPQTSGKYNFQAQAALAYAIWTESSKNGAAGFTQDAVYLKKVAVVGPSYRAQTDQFEGNPAAGAKLKTLANGKLGVESSTGAYVAICLKARYDYVHNGTTIQVIDIQTI